MTIDQLERLGKYYLPDNELLADDFEFVLANSPDVRREFTFRQNDPNKTDIMRNMLNIGYDILDYCKFYLNCEQIHDHQGSFLFSAKSRCVRYESGKRKTEYIDFSKKRFNPQGNTLEHTVTVGNYTFSKFSPIRYNFLIMLLKWSDKKLESGEFPVSRTLNAKPFLITKELQDKYGIIIDISSKVPFTVGYCEYNVLDEHLISKAFPVRGGLCLYISQIKGPCYSIREMSYSLSSPHPHIGVFPSPYNWEFFGSQKFFDLYFFKRSNDYEILGDDQQLTIYIIVNDGETYCISLHFCSEKDYYSAAAWFIVVLFFYSSLSERSRIREYWPTCPVFSREAMFSAIESSLQKVKELTAIPKKLDDNTASPQDRIDAMPESEQIEALENDTTNNTTAKESNAMIELEQLVGLDSIKNDVKNLISLVKVQKLRKDKGLKSIPVSLHLVFTGNPGTGKTTVARILAQLYKEIGILETGQLVEVDRADLVAGYVGQTALKTEEKIKEAMGGILFIDEAYTLSKDGYDFGQEAIDTILKEMEDHREKFVVIVAGYDEPMQRFINSNPGLKSRFNKYFHFPDYSPTELMTIFQSMLSKYDYKITEDALEKCSQIIDEMESHKGNDFANARDIRNLFERIISHQASRIANLDNSTDTDIVTIQIDDILKA